MLLAAEQPALGVLGMSDAARRAIAKLIESFPDKVRETTQRAMRQFPVHAEVQRPDSRVAAFADAVRGKRIVRVNAGERSARIIHPTTLQFSGTEWTVADAQTGEDIPLHACGDINISAHRFA